MYLITNTMQNEKIKKTEISIQFAQNGVFKILSIQNGQNGGFGRYSKVEYVENSFAFSLRKTLRSLREIFHAKAAKRKHAKTQRQIQMIISKDNPNQRTFTLSNPYFCNLTIF